MSTFLLSLFIASAPQFHQPVREDDDPQRDAKPVTVAAKTAELERLPTAQATAGESSVLDLWVDRPGGKLWLRIPPPSGDDGEALRLLYVEGLRTGLGSNPVGLDRGQIGPTRVVRFRHAGGRVLLEEPNLGFRADQAAAAEVLATRESFASSVLWAAPVAARDADGTVLVDFTSFVVRDAHGSARTLKSTGEGSWKLDAGRSAFLDQECLLFPDNVELEALLTFASEDPGRHVRSVTPTAQSVTLVQHHSFVRLPDDGYRPRTADPRLGHGIRSYVDYAAPLGRDPVVRLAVRHRLEKVDPSAERSTVVEPIVYWLDPGTPEPVRSALLDGARWWAEAFEAAGFIDAYRVEVLPADVHPLDVRYNVIQWVHRSTRGWSYGGGVTDPRTGEMIKGHVSLGSLRVRQDRLLFEGLLGIAETGTGSAEDPIELALARLRQLSAHEVGHTLGLSHNFAASSWGRASVMDYPAPLVRMVDGEIDVSQAYGVGVADWDRHAIHWLYAQFAPNTDEAAALDRIARSGIDRGYLFLTDADARPLGASDPRGSLWDNGADAVAELENALAVRQYALKRFGSQNLFAGLARTKLQEVFVPVYFHHRYQLEAAIKTLGGVEYQHALVGDGQPTERVISGVRQRHALATILRSLWARGMDVPDAIAVQLAPRAPGHDSNRELAAGGTAPMFDVLGLASTIADMTFRGLLAPERCGRIAEQYRRDPSTLGLHEYVQTILAQTFIIEADPRFSSLNRAFEEILTTRLMDLADDARASFEVRAVAEAALGTIAVRDNIIAGMRAELDHRDKLMRDVQSFLERRVKGTRSEARIFAAPPGSPIGHEAIGCSHGH